MPPNTAPIGASTPSPAPTLVTPNSTATIGPQQTMNGIVGQGGLVGQNGVGPQIVTAPQPAPIMQMQGATNKAAGIMQPTMVQPGMTVNVSTTTSTPMSNPVGQVGQVSLENDVL